MYLAIAFAAGQINPRLTRFQQDRNREAPGSIDIQSYERFFEVDYTVQIAPWLSLRPNLQYLICPAATRNIRDVFVVGLDTLVTFRAMIADLLRSKPCLSKTISTATERGCTARSTAPSQVGI
jgi:hypothetical protein